MITLQRLRRQRTLNGESGLSLVEFVVYAALLVLIMISVVGVFMSVNNAQVKVTGVVGASNQAQVTATQISNAVRNSSALSVVVPTAGDQMLLTRTAKAGSPVSWVCEAWYYQSAANSATGVGSIRFKISPTQIGAPAASTLSTWAVVATGVTPSSGTTVFTPVVTANGVATESFSFGASANGQQPQLITTSVSTPMGNTGGSPCF